MTRCASVASTCDGLDIQPVLLYLRRTTRPLCSGCRAALDRLGASYTVAAPEAPAKPRWLANLTARDETWRSAA